MNTLSDLKRFLVEGAKVERLTRYGKEAKAILVVVKVQTNGVYLAPVEAQDRKSWIDFPPASLLEVDDKGFRIYNIGTRPMNVEEQKVWDNVPVDKKQTEIDALSDGSTMFYRERAYFINAGFEYLFGGFTSHNLNVKRLDHNSMLVKDPEVKGELILEYKFI